MKNDEATSRMTGRLARRWRSALFAALGAGAAYSCASTATEQSDSQTHFFADCDDDAGCDDSFRCLCGRCTVSCQAAPCPSALEAECADDGSDAVIELCGATASGPLCVPRGAEGGVAEGGVIPEDASPEGAPVQPRPESGSGNAACPDVFSDPLPPDSSRNDRGPLGLSELHRRVLESQSRWETAKAAIGNRYSYTTHYSFSFSGNCDHTVVVTNGEVSSVAVAHYEGSNISTAEVQTADAIGPTDCSSLPGPLSLDEMYATCLTETLCNDPRETWIMVEFDEDGLLAQCSFFPMGCADDCTEGIERFDLRLGDDARDCCPISAEPACCMAYGGGADGCGEACDGMPLPDAAWERALDEYGCPHWVEPTDAVGCCGCVDPENQQ